MNNEKNHSDTVFLRIKAEEKLKTKQNIISASDTENDAIKLMHELQVHQIELEMQNEELRKAAEEVENALRKYTMLYDLAPMGYFTLEPDGTIIELNFAGAEILQDKRSRLVGTNFKLFVSNESTAQFNEFFSDIFKFSYKQSCKVKLSHDNNQLGYVYMEGISIDEEKCLLSVIKTTKLQK